MNLNLGCGTDIKKGWVNCDNAEELPKGVMRVDASYPLPFPDEHFDLVLASHVLEHIPNWEGTIEECHRVLKPVGRLIVRVPFGLALEPYHVRSFGLESMSTFCQDNDGTSLQHPKKRLFRMRSVRTRRSFWFSWHLQHYLGLRFLVGRRWDFPMGKKVEIIWVLEKPKVNL